VGARLIAHAGSFDESCQHPASTVQTRSALLEHSRRKGTPPKYGLIYTITFAGRAAQKNKGRISRILANKVSIASRIDCFMDNPDYKFGSSFVSRLKKDSSFMRTVLHHARTLMSKL
jgi:nucleolar protein 56